MAVTLSPYGVSYLTMLMHIGRAAPATTYYRGQGEEVLSELGAAVEAGPDTNGKFAVELGEADWYYVIDTLRTIKTDVADYDRYSKMLRRTASAVFTHLVSDTEVGEL